MTVDEFPSISFHYSRLSRFAFGAVALILAYGGVSAVLGLMPADPDQRSLQIVIGLVFAAVAAGIGFMAVRMYAAGGNPVLTLDRNGLWDRRLTIAPVPWADITEIEGVEAGFIESLVMPSRRSARIIAHIAPEAWGRLAFAQGLSAGLFRRLAVRNQRLQISHVSLDIGYRPLIAAIAHTWQFARDQGPETA